MMGRCGLILLQIELLRELVKDLRVLMKVIQSEEVLGPAELVLA